jgi:tetratricopeptide (TPR) repeat protein
MVTVTKNRKSLALIFRRSIFAAVLMSLISAQARAESRGPAEAQATRNSSASHYKELGDQYVSQERFRDAADAYGQALALGREQFKLDDRVRMAIYISWEDRLDAAVDELRRVIVKDPAHVGARIHLARVYSWAGELDAAISQADAALRLSPGNPEALLVKADALEWKGKYGQAIPIYRKILEDRNRFDAGLGLSYALLSAGNQTGAGKNARSLAPSNARERTQLDKLQNEIDGITRPKVDLRYNEYRDSDHNYVDRYSLLYGVGLGNKNLELSLKRTNTQSRTADNASEAASFSVVSNVGEGLRFRIGAGLRRSGLVTKRNFATGQLRQDAIVSNATITGFASTDLLDDTSGLIDSHIRVTSYGGHVSKPWTDRFSTSGGYTYRTFSDGNRSQDVQFTPQYTLVSLPRIAMGYRFRFLDFRGQSGSGFFDPDNYVSHRLFGSISVEKEKISTYFDVFTGKQRFVRYANPTDDWIVGGSAAVAFKPIRQLLIEVNAEGGDSVGESITGFKSSTVGLRVLYRF